MKTETWKAQVKLGSSLQWVTVQADSSWNAKAILEKQYGKENIRMGPNIER